MYFYLSKILAPFLNLTNLLFIFFIILILINLKKNIIFKKLVTSILFILILISFFPFGKLGLKFLENDFLYQKKFSKIENIIVLSGSEDLETTEITNKMSLGASSERLIMSVKIANENPESIIYHLGGNGFLINQMITENDVAKKFYSNVGFDLNRVRFIGNSRNTIENLNSIKNKNFDTEKSILITSAFHMKRVMMISKKLEMSFIPYAVDFKSISHSSFVNYYQTFSVAENWSFFNIFFREMIGILAFKMIY